MIEELKELVGVIANLPQLALWVVIGVWAYKVLIVGSVYGVIRFSIVKVSDWVHAHQQRKIREAELKLEEMSAPKVQPLVYDASSFMISESVWSDAKNVLMDLATYQPELRDSLLNMRVPHHKKYFHSTDVQRLRRAVQLLREEEASQKATGRAA